MAFLVLSVGLIGLAGLQLTGVKNTREAYHRTQATVLAADIMDRMRANLDAVADDAYDAQASGTATPNCIKTAGCTSAQMAAHDIAEWRDAITAHLPAGDAIVCTDSTPADGVSAASPACDGSGELSVVKVWWLDPAGVADDNGVRPLQRFVTVFHP